MTSFYYHDQNPSGFCFLVQILNMKGKTKTILVIVVKNDAIMQMAFSKDPNLQRG